MDASKKFGILKWWWKLYFRDPERAMKIMEKSRKAFELKFNLDDDSPDRDDGSASDSSRS